MVWRLSRRSHRRTRRRAARNHAFAHWAALDNATFIHRHQRQSPAHDNASDGNGLNHRMASERNAAADVNEPPERRGASADDEVALDDAGR